MIVSMSCSNCTTQIEQLQNVAGALEGQRIYVSPKKCTNCNMKNWKPNAKTLELIEMHRIETKGW